MPEPSPSRRLDLLICAGLVLLVLLAFEPVRHNAFVEFDDNQYLFENTHLRSGFTAESVAWAFTSGYAANWHPVTWLSHAADVAVFGLEPLGHHLHNVLLHALDTVLLFLVLRLMTSLRPANGSRALASAQPPAQPGSAWPAGAVWPGAFVALLFGLHPLHVESVAWAAERKDMLSALFFMLTLWAYAKYVSGGKVANIQQPTSNNQHPMRETADSASRTTHHASRWYGLCLLCFALGLMSKPMLVTLPFVLLLLDYWPLKRVSSFKFQVSSEKETSNIEHRTPNAERGESPVAHHAPRTTHRGDASPVSHPQSAIGSRQSAIPPLLEKVPFLLLSLASCVITYLVQQHGKSMTPDLPLAFRVANALASCVAYLGKLFWPADLAVLYPYPVTWPLWKPVAAGLILVLLSAFAWSQRSRRPWLLAGWLWYLVMLIPVIGLVQVGAQARADRYTYLPSIGIFIMLAWGADALTAGWRQRKLVLAGCGALIAVALAAVTRAQVNCWRDSVTLFAHAVAVTENNHTMHHSLGWALAKEGRLDEAAVHLRRSLELRPDPETTLDLADVLIRQKQFDAATPLLEKVLKAQPTNSMAFYNQGIILQLRKQFDAAASAYEQAVRFDPDNAKAFNNLGMLKAQQGSLEEAADCFRHSLRSAPDYAPAHRNLATILQLQGRIEDAVTHCRAALRLDPDDADTSWQLAGGLHALGRLREAAAQCRETLRLKPDHVPSLNDLAWILATAPDDSLRRPLEAIPLARRACELTGFQEAEFLDTLAAAHAGAGQFKEALETAQKALDLAKTSAAEDLARDIERRLELYQASKPYSESPAQNPSSIPGPR
jgi:tetratricopeptide (TPR) repeat protein